MPEVNCAKDKADILIRSGSCSIMLELLSNERYAGESHGKIQRSSVLGHIERATKYGATLNAEAWIVHFISVPEFPSLHEFPDTPTCSCAYVYHLHDFSSVWIVSKKKNSSKVRTDKCK